jgi:hypothetical protein
VVRELNAHSWAEVYFPEIGWVEFEPTASQPEIDRSQLEVTAASDQGDGTTASDLLYRFKLVKAISWLSPIAGLLVLSLLYFTLIERWWFMRLAPEAAIERMYRRLYRLGRPLAGERARAETAREFMQRLIDKVLEISERSRFRKLFFGARQDIELLTKLYQDMLFSRNNMQKNDSRRAFDTWRNLRLRLMVARALSLRARSAKQSAN